MSAFSGHLRDVISWHVRTQTGARRNALVGLTELTERCREHGEVREFIERLAEPESQPMTKTDAIISANLLCLSTTAASIAE
jgi:midasin (ATPase involved in ribosome maturation)